ncbi:hypothetical protein MNBD_GAMMA24-1130 [hydrothermal vent metagenome]|uniref:Uncharacterized protein n=1 Tax=hydrothermal vent metagenome TaxID=652676 RepID=A0A3B1B4S9_9ZZZZ
MSSIADFTDTENKLVQDSLHERYGKDVETNLVDVELRIYPDDHELTECPAHYWEQDGCHFILAKTGDSEYFSQFFYGNREQFGTGRDRYDDLFNCIITLLQVQADHDRDRKMNEDNS